MHHPLPIHLGYVYLADLVPKTSRIFRTNINAPTSTAALIQIDRVSIEVNSSPAWLSVSPSRSFWRCPGEPAGQNCSLWKIYPLAKSLYAATLGSTKISTTSLYASLDAGGHAAGV